MSPMRLPAVAALAALMTISATTFAAAQATDAAPQPEEMPDQDVQADRPDRVRGDGMRGDRMRHRDRMRGMQMHRQMMKIMFAITDADNDGALSFEEISTIHRRIFDKVDVNRDGKVTPDEIQTFIRD
ncbi:EF-hand domain-containing protein [Sinorhizobium numidicum]|uniref:EF-hand domain-containing protein n=1 Tax=Sinorhizobium numidicum TaxID=680248 RepID=A0ABY8CXA9_9HYPH|nr:EF-hand domain-containing protein [Sinorhizobium numidicum]WEX76625.1 EF-hand domain-containing protein [Sinorhizobium numidicum]WEX83286.1 EF-hand domain-containing protein [Sinorhizobium numidicum]